MHSLKGKVFVVTGGTSGLGLETTKALLGGGAKVIALYRENDTKAARLSSWAEKQHATSLKVVKLDVTDRTLCLQFADQIKHEYGSLGGLVNNAATMVRADIQNVTEPEMTAVLQNNVLGLVNITQALWSMLIVREGNAIVNVSSAASRTGKPNELIYAASKGAVEAITRTLARDGGAHGLSVNAIAPHVIQSGMGQETLLADPTIVSRIPFKRAGEAAEFVALVLFLLSGSSPYLTGQVLHLNGGRLMMG